MKKKQPILWIDLEMTGLEPSTERIVEIAAIVTDWEFNEIAHMETIVKQEDHLLTQMDSAVVAMHTKSGLIGKIASGIEEAVADQMLADFIAEHCGKTGVLLAGNSIHQDRRFIRKYFPKTEKTLHYRMLDVSAFKVVFSNLSTIKYKKQNAHRALDDIKASIEEMQLYLQYIDFAQDEQA